MIKDSLRKWCRENWNKVPAEKRKACVDHLEGWIPAETLAEWKGTGIPVDAHFSGGMQIRNRLRDVMRDQELPLIQVNAEGEPYNGRNWDDYYTGAVDELLERVHASPKDQAGSGSNSSRS